MPRNRMIKPERHTVWTPAEEAMLISGFQAGMPPERIAEALCKTPGSISWKLNALGLRKGNPDATGPILETVTMEDYRARQSDLAFKRAMLNAIAAGAEKAVPCVVRAKRAKRYIPCIHAPSNSGYGSSAALAAELGSREAPPLGDAQREGHPRTLDLGGARRTFTKVAG
jgi:hypothetical protein